jgi:trehalose/maltose transport system substrate-binding protein
LVRFLCRKDIEKDWALTFSEPPTLPELYNTPEVLADNPYFEQLKPVFEGRFLMRPARITGKRYEQVSKAYFQAVHAVLTKEESATQAAAELENKLAQTTAQN